MRLDTDSRTSQETLTERARKGRNRRRPSTGDGHAGNGRKRANGKGADGVARAAKNGAPAVDPRQGDQSRGLTADQITMLEKRLHDERARAIRTLWAKRVDMEDHRDAGTLDEVEFDIRMAERHSEFIGLIDDALRRLREAPEFFDVSVVSGARIPFERLEMVPWTRRLTEEVGSAHD